MAEGRFTRSTKPYSEVSRWNYRRVDDVDTKNSFLFVVGVISVGLLFCSNHPMQSALKAMSSIPFETHENLELSPESSIQFEGILYCAQSSHYTTIQSFGSNVSIIVIIIILLSFYLLFLLPILKEPPDSLFLLGG